MHVSFLFRFRLLLDDEIVLKGVAFYEKLWDSRSEAQYDDSLIK